MRFSWKMFLYTYIMIVLSFSLGGFMIIEAAFFNNIQAKEENLIENNNNLCSTYLTMLALDEKLGTNMAIPYRNNLYQDTEDTRVYIGAMGLVEGYDKEFFNQNVQTGKRYVRMIERDGKRCLQVILRDDRMGNYTCVETLESVEDLYEGRDENYRQFQVILLVVSGMGAVFLWLMSIHLTIPLKRLADTAKKIGSGDFTIRAKENHSSLEVRVLTEEFNKMAGYVESYVEELKEENRRREEFVGNFTHELKTPLTSVIGYADLLRSYELDGEKRRQFAEYIYKEGIRLEALALHLLNLLVLRKEEFELCEITAKYFFHELKEQLFFLLEKYECRLELEVEDGIFLGESDLLKTLLYNLVDNGCKAMQEEHRERERKITIYGKKEDGCYRICVEDLGRGIAPEEIKKITEAFYMVDKSRARTMGGAGLGLALCKQIAEIHHSTLEIESKQGEGSRFSIALAQAGEEKHE